MAVCPFFCNFATENDTNKQHPTDHAMNETRPASFGRTELASRYFPNIEPGSAWKKLAAIMREHPELLVLAAKRRRRTYTPAECQEIFKVLGVP